METLKFKTNINCSGCVSAITPFLNRSRELEEWKVDLNDPDKVLIVTGKKLDAQRIIGLVEEAGFEVKGKV
jgi:copper chaperone CopZ